jgi:phosphate transport system substrate-binding protein
MVEREGTPGEGPLSRALVAIEARGSERPRRSELPGPMSKLRGRRERGLNKRSLLDEISAAFTHFCPQGRGLHVHLKFMKRMPVVNMPLLACGGGSDVPHTGAGVDWGAIEKEEHTLMKHSWRLARVLVIALAIALVAAACGNNDDGGASASEGGADLSGSITVSGSSTVEPISAANAEKFSAENPGVQISVEGPGTGDGFELFCQGKTDISDASRPIEAEELAACEKEGIEFIELKVGIDGIAVLTSPENQEVECLSFKDLYALLGPESEGFGSWSNANSLAQEVGADHAPYPDIPLDITAPGEESGTYDSFAEIVLEDIAYEERGIKEDAPVIRPDYQASANDNVIIQGIQGSDSSLGWVGYAFYVNNQDTVRAIPIAEEGDNCVEPTQESIQSTEYPISRNLYIYVNKQAADQNEAVSAYVDFYLSEQGLSSVEEVGYVSLHQEDLDETISVWESKETGSREQG